MSANDDEAPPEFLDERSLCALLAISSVTATKWRAKVKGPPFIKVGRLVRYRPRPAEQTKNSLPRSDVEAWLRACTVGQLSA